MLPLERLQHALASRTAQVRLLGFDIGSRDEIAQFFRNAGYPVIHDADSSAATVPVPMADVVVWNVPCRMTLAQGVETKPLIEDTQRVAEVLRPGQLLVVTGVVPPGTTRGIILPRLTATGLRLGHNFIVAYTPHFERNKPRALSELGSTGSSVAAVCLRLLMLEVVEVSTLETAELCGLLPQVYRTVQLAVGNELRVLGDRIGASFWEAIAAVGLPELAPTTSRDDSAAALLTWGARRFDFTPRLSEVAKEIHASVPAFLLAKLEETLNTRGRPLRESRILLLGGRFASPTDSNRTSVADELRVVLHKKGALVAIHDPNLTKSTGLAPLTAELLASQHVVVILECHTACDYEFLVSHGQLILDTQHATTAVVHGREKIVIV